ncbi:hypothetical protein [Flavobacterium johnsoniae]|uniref:Uncharacterized protein n=1 Tax=Flavobacterium johnsoniae TaxID=986 RepID=A0A1J7CQY7_FLAJO|nr:hypothetical protein [Flavobacterium johnsoniae]OIV42058.1 hypothetical protein BKM63_10420 [Flavobacterium johnsoniae]
MKMIKFEDFPISMTSENIEILAEMMMAMSPSEEWRKISDIISYEERNLIRERVKEIQMAKEKKRWESLTLEEQENEKRKMETSIDEDTKTFRGNILQQERDSIELEKRNDENKQNI